MLSDLFHWWLRQMAGLLPRFLRPGAGDGHTALVATLDAPGNPAVVLSLRRRGREAVLCRAGPEEPPPARLPRSGPAVLRVPAGTVLEREVTLPLSAEHVLRQVLTLEMDRLTPFAAGDVVWGFRASARDRTRGRVSLRLFLVPRRAVAAALASLDRLGIAVGALECGAGEGARRITLERPATVRERRAKWVTSGLGAACAVLAVAVLLVPVVRQAEALSAAESRIEAVRPRVAEAEALRRRIADSRANRDGVAAQRARSGDVLGALAALTDSLPDDTYLTELSLSRRILLVRGQSAAAPRLITLLAGAPSFSNPAFTAPVTRNGQLDQFALQAEVAP